MTSYDVGELGQHYSRYWLGALHQAITWNIVDLSSQKHCGINLTAISQKLLINFIRKCDRGLLYFLKLLPPPRGQWVNSTWHDTILQTVRDNNEDGAMVYTGITKDTMDK